MSDFTCVLDGCDRPSRNRGSATVCVMHYMRMRKNGSYERTTRPRKKRAYYVQPRPLCIVDGCDRFSRTVNRTHCEMHRLRLRRTGTYTPPPPRQQGPVLDVITGYLRKGVPGGHILASGTARVVFHHRLVLFDQIGLGPHRCAHCACHVNWGTTLQVDHLDSVRTNNVPDNLVPCCNRCNTARAEHGRSLMSGQFLPKTTTAA